MRQDEINRLEWENPDNWSSPIFGVYFSKRDRRTWVPKKWPGFGWTLNLGHPRSLWWLVGLILVPSILAGCLSRRSVQYRTGSHAGSDRQKRFGPPR